MIRRIVSLILITALLANQSMLCCAQAHGGFEAGNHSSRPHLHLSGHPHQHSCDGHHHHGAGGDHLDHDRADQLKIENSVELEDSDNAIDLLESLDLSEHGQSAIYIDSQINLHVSVGRILLVNLPTTSIQWPVVESIQICSPVVVRCKVFREAVPLGLFSAAHCAIFLQTARLLI